MMNQIIKKNIKAVIFDMDGTLVDNIPYHEAAWMKFLKKHQIQLTQKELREKNRGNIDEMIRRFFGSHLPESEVKTLGREREKMYRDLYRGNIRETDGLTPLLQRLKERKILCALASMSDEPHVDLVIDALKIRHYFHSITHGLEIQKGKPDPEIYELALKKMGLKETDCVVIEDSMSGIMSARNAGIEVIGMMTSHTANELMNHGCISTISNFNEIEV